MMDLVAALLICIGFSNWLTADCQSFYTVPKNKPAKQSTSFQTGENSALANNGDRGGTYNVGVSCFHTNGADPGPWWLLDMGQTYLISGVSIWNRLDNDCAPRFTHIGVGLTSNPTIWTTFSIDLLDLCLFRSDVPTAADNPLNFTCSRPTSGRYLAVYKVLAGVPSGLEAFHFCEIDIFAFTKDSSYSLVAETPPSFSATSTSLLTVAPQRARSQLECAIQCSAHPTCLYVLARISSHECWLFASFSIPNSFISVFNGSDSVKFLAMYGGPIKPQQ